MFDQSEQDPQISLVNVENQIREYLPPGSLNDKKIMQQFGQAGKKNRFIKKEGIDNYIFKQIESGNLERVLSEYQKKRLQAWQDYLNAPISVKEKPI